jgi:hypothetical protein
MGITKPAPGLAVPRVVALGGVRLAPAEDWECPADSGSANPFDVSGGRSAIS